MPNHVYNTISVEEEYADKLKEIAKVGLAQYYKPRPKDIEGTTAPSDIGSNITQEDYDRLVSKYGCADWYTWSIREWGTKWGCYDNEFDGCTYTFTTAWNTVDDGIIDMLLHDIPSFIFSWQEEQGFGCEVVYRDRVELDSFDWDLPNWEYTEDDDIYFLPNEYTNNEGTFRAGYYAYMSLEEYLGDTYEESLKIMK